MKLFCHLFCLCMAVSTALSTPLQDPRDSGVAPGAEAVPKVETKSIEITNCRMTEGRGTPTIRAKMETDQGPLELPESTWSLREEPTGACTVLIDISDHRRRAEQIGRSFSFAKEIVKAFPETTHIRVKLVGRDCYPVVASTNADERRVLLQYLDGATQKASAGRLEGITSSMSNISMLSSVCSVSVRELATDTSSGQKIIILFSDGKDESGDSVTARAQNRQEMIRAATDAGVQITCFGCYESNDSYRAGHPWMQSTSQDTRGLCISSIGKEEPTISGTGEKGCAPVAATLAKAYTSDIGQFSLNVAQVHTPGDICITLTREGGTAQLHLPKDLVAQALETPQPPPAPPEEEPRTQEPEEPAAPSEEEQERARQSEALATKLRAYCTNGATLLQQVSTLLEKATLDRSSITQYEVRITDRHADQILTQLNEIREANTDLLRTEMEKLRNDAELDANAKRFLELTASLITAQEAPAKKALLTALGCTDGELPQPQPTPEPKTDPVIWYVAAACSSGFMVLLLLLFIRTRNKKKKKKVRPEGVLAELRNLTNGEVWYITTPQFTIGRASDRDACIADDSVSFHHCQLRLEDNKTWALIDEGSTNRIFADGETTTYLELTDGTMFELGSVKFLFNTKIKS